MAREWDERFVGGVSRETRRGSGSASASTVTGSGGAGRTATREAGAGVDVPRETPAADPLEGSLVVREFFGAAFPVVATYLSMLSSDGLERGLVGPREVDKLWERHALNSASVVPFLPTEGRLIDVGSGAGLPGIVLAAMRPDQEVVLVDPMERRTSWLLEVVEACGLANVVVVRARAEELHGSLVGRGVTARAVAPLDRLARWTLPLLESGGVLVALKGQKAAAELEQARPVLRRLGAVSAEVLEAHAIRGVDSTTVVKIVLHTGTK